VAERHEEQGQKDAEAGARLVERVREALRREADAAWEGGDKAGASAMHAVARAIVPPSPAAMAEPAVAVLWALVPELDRRAADLERQRDEARAEAERLRLGRVELQAMHRAAVAEVERLRSLRPSLEAVLRAVPPPMPGDARTSRIALAVDFLRDAYAKVWP